MFDFEAVLYKLPVQIGKENIAKEWLQFLDSNKESASNILIREKGLYEVYFLDQEKEQTFIFMFFSSEDIDFSNQTALESNNEIDLKHFEYMRACIEFNDVVVMPAVTEFNTFRQRYLANKDGECNLVD